jgi:hypothetical protein
MTDYVLELLILNTRLLIEYLDYKQLIKIKRISKKYNILIKKISIDYDKNLGITNKKLKDEYIKSEKSLKKKTKENNKLKKLLLKKKNYNKKLIKEIINKFTLKSKELFHLYNYLYKYNFYNINLINLEEIVDLYHNHLKNFELKHIQLFTIYISLGLHKLICFLFDERYKNYNKKFYILNIGGSNCFEVDENMIFNRECSIKDIKLLNLEELIIELKLFI